MLIATIIMAILAIILVWVGYSHGGKHAEGLRIASRLTFEVLPLLIFAFIVAGMVQVILPRELVSQWVGAQSGLRGILIGSVAGGLTPGGPFVTLPVAAGLLRAGAGIPTMVAFVTAWSLWAVARLPMEFGIMGWKFTMIRLASTFIFPPIAGLITQLFFSNLK